MGEPHTRTSTDAGPDYCAECSSTWQEWVKWPCDKEHNPRCHAWATTYDAALSCCRGARYHADAAGPKPSEAVGPLIVWAVAFRPRCGGPWNIVTDDRCPVVFDDRRFAERRADAMAEVHSDYLYMPLPMQGHPLLMEATSPAGIPSEGER